IPQNLMAQILTDATRHTLTQFAEQVRKLPNETAKRERFAALLGELFPGEPIQQIHAQGAERGIRIERSGASTTGRADTYYGHAVIEFETSLKATGEHAKEQLCDYVAGIW